MGIVTIEGKSCSHIDKLTVLDGYIMGQDKTGEILFVVSCPSGSQLVHGDCTDIGKIYIEGKCAVSGVVEMVKTRTYLKCNRDNLFECSGVSLNGDNAYIQLQGKFSEVFIGSSLMSATFENTYINTLESKSIFAQVSNPSYTTHIIEIE